MLKANLCSSEKEKIQDHLPGGHLRRQFREGVRCALGVCAVDRALGHGSGEYAGAPVPMVEQRAHRGYVPPIPSVI